MQNLAIPGRLDLLTFSVVPFPAGGVVAFVWDSAHGSPCVQFVRSIERICDEDLPEALVRLAFEHFENTFANPRWWERLSSSERDQFQLRFATAASPENRQSNCLAETVCGQLVGRLLQGNGVRKKRARRALVSSFQRKHSRKRSAMFTNWSRGYLGFPANSKPVLTRSRLQSCWVKACASIFSPPAYRTRSKVCKQPALP